jgi:RNA polymerase sigma factor (sigma-70 family)
MSPLSFSLLFLQAQPDDRLVSLAQAGHERAFEALVRRYRAPLLAYCRRLGSGDVSPEDVLQQALINAWRALTAGSDVRDARAWLYRIVHNVAISNRRASGEGPADFDSGAGAAGVEQLVEQRLAVRDALAGLAALPELQRQVMLGTVLDGHSHEEMATELGITSGSVRGLIYRARATLRAAAAAVSPTPLVHWALRQPPDSGLAGAGSTGLIGGGTAGVSGLILKGGAILATGALAGAAAIVVGHPSHQRHAIHGSQAPGAAQRHAIDLAADRRLPASTLSGHSALAGVARAAATRGGATRGRDSSGGPGGGGGDGPGGGSGSDGRSGGSDIGSSDGGDHGTAAAPTTSDGGRSDGSSGGGSSGSDGGATTASSGGSSDGGTVTSSSSGSSDGGTVTSSGSGSSDGGTVTTTTSGSSDGGAIASSGGGSSDGDTVTTTTSGS